MVEAFWSIEERIRLEIGISWGLAEGSLGADSSSSGANTLCPQFLIHALGPAQIYADQRAGKDPSRLIGIKAVAE